MVNTPDTDAGAGIVVQQHRVAYRDRIINEEAFRAWVCLRCADFARIKPS